ncbi:hypothetical protein V2W45_1464544 [Cenococcum geophilum]
MLPLYNPPAQVKPAINNNTIVSPHNYVYDESGSIPDTYNDYHEEIRLYTCCNTWLNDWVLANLQHTDITFDTHCHTTQSYLEGGNVFYFLYMPEAYLHDTTSIGLYIHSNDAYSEMNWVTYEPPLKGIIEKWKDEGMVYKLAADCWLHKAYFLTLTEQNPGNLFSRRTPPPTPPVFAKPTFGVAQTVGDRADSDGPRC